jgi:hypothetical protein
MNSRKKDAARASMPRRSNFVFFKRSSLTNSIGHE